MTHQSVTGKARVKRADTRPNHKVKHKRERVIEAQKTAQDIKVTRVRPAEKKERTVAPLAKKELNKNEIRMRSLKKKLRSIEDLLERQKKGEQLDDAQFAKIARLEELLAEIEALIGAQDGEVDEEEKEKVDEE